MGTNKLKRMNRFELLELMYRLVKENEELRRRCEKLESRNGVPEREKTSYPAPHSTASTWVDEDEHFRTRREEVMQRMMEQTIQPPPRKPVPPAAPVKKKDAGAQSPAVRKAEQPKPQATKAVVPEPVNEKPVRSQPTPQPRAKPSPTESFDIESILNEYLSDTSSGGSGGRL